MAAFVKIAFVKLESVCVCVCPHARVFMFASLCRLIATALQSRCLEKAREEITRTLGTEVLNICF